MKLLIKPNKTGLCLLICLLLICSPGFKVQAANAYPVVINEAGSMDQTVLRGGRHYVPLSTGSEALGYHVEWVQSAHLYKMTNPEHRIEISLLAHEPTVDGKEAGSLYKEMFTADNQVYIAVQALAKLTGSLIDNNNNRIHISASKRFIKGEAPDATFWLSDRGVLSKLTNNGEVKSIGDLKLDWRGQGYFKMGITAISSTHSYIITATKFSGEPLIVTNSVKAFVTKDAVVQAVTFGDEETPQTAKVGDYWIFSNGQIINYLNDEGQMIKSINASEIIGKDSYTVDGFVGDHIILVQSSSKKLLWGIDTNSNQAVLLYKKVLSMEEQKSIENNTDVTDMHYGDNLHLLTVRNGVVTFNYFSYLKGATDTEIGLKVTDFEKLFN